MFVLTIHANRSKGTILKALSTTALFRLIFAAHSLMFLGDCSSAKTVASSVESPAVSAFPSQGMSAGTKRLILRLVAEPQVNGAVVSSMPDPAPYGLDGSYPAVTLKWAVPNATKVEIHMQKPDGILFSQGAGSGSATTGSWVQAQSIFYFQDTTAGEPGKTSSIVKVVVCNDCKL